MGFVRILPVALILAGCDPGQAPSNPSQYPEYQSSTLIPPDLEVLDIVLRDLVTHEGFKTAPRFNDHGKLVVWDHTGEHSAYLSRAQVAGDVGDHAISDDVLSVLGIRNAHPVKLEAFTPSAPGVTVVAQPDLPPGRPFLEAFAKRFPETRGFIGFWLPAYGDDGKTALVRFRFGPTAHGATGTYFLEASEGGWRIAWRAMAYYA